MNWQELGKLWDINAYRCCSPDNKLMSSELDKRWQQKQETTGNEGRQKRSAEFFFIKDICECGQGTRANRMMSSVPRHSRSPLRYSEHIQWALALLKKAPFNQLPVSDQRVLKVKWDVKSPQQWNGRLSRSREFETKSDSESHIKSDSESLATFHGRSPIRDHSAPLHSQGPLGKFY